MFTIAVLITCHNRKFKTLQCLSNLYTQEGIFTEFNLDVFLVDDASSDGTSEEVRKLFPTVNIIKGSGNLYWNRGMYLAWKNASEKSTFDYYLWLNDDTFLFNNALSILFQASDGKSIIVGTTQSKETLKPTYGGYLKHNLIIPNETIQYADYSNGNCLLIPFSVFQKIGALNPFYHHALGDFDYTLRAYKSGIKIFVSKKFVGFCEMHKDLPKWKSSSYSLKERIRFLYHPKSGCSPIEFFKFDCRHNGFLLGILHFFTIHFRVFFPESLKKRY